MGNKSKLGRLNPFKHVTQEKLPGGSINEYVLWLKSEGWAFHNRVEADTKSRSGLKWTVAVGHPWVDEGKPTLFTGLCLIDALKEAYWAIRSVMPLKDPSPVEATALSEAQPEAG